MFFLKLLNKLVAFVDEMNRVLKKLKLIENLIKIRRYMFVSESLKSFNNDDSTIFLNYMTK